MSNAAKSLLVLLPILPACGGGGSTTPSDSSPTAIVTASPQPASWPITPCGGCGTLAGELETTGFIAFSETAGVAVTFTTLDVSALNASGAVTNTSQTRPVSVRVGARGQATTDVAFHFPPAAQAASERISFGGRDDNGHTITTTLTVPLR